ncbi:MAG TPA: sulfatase [Thermoanaerobaculia bacterium]|nr:sulfatase [Thermoanaerobaculia bacterium]
MTLRPCASLAIACALSLPTVAVGGPADAPRPNILFIMADDHAESAISAYGSELVATPNIDRIAREGVRFDNAFVTNSICAPSRAVLLTGKYSHRNGLRDNRDEFDGDQVTFPKLLQRAGYQTAIVGKWHLKTTPTGFDHWDVLVGQGHYYRPVFLVNGEEVERPGYATDLITEAALSFLENRDRDRPFALLLHNKAPHRNWMPAIRHLDLYDGRDLPVPATFWDDYEERPAAAGQDMRVADMYLSFDAKLHRSTIGEETGTGGQAGFPALEAWEASYERLGPDEKAAWDAHYDPINEAFASASPAGRELAEWKLQRYLKDYLSTVAAIDEGVGRVLDALDEQGIADHTLVVYTSDQGFFLGEHGWFDKRFIYEQSLSMPLLVRYPRAVAGGRVSTAMALNLDFAQTFLDYAGVEAPADMQGRSLRPLLEGDPPADWRTSMYYRYYEFPHGWHDVRPHYGVRTERYKLVRFQGDLDVWELYDLAEDPQELRNRYRDPALSRVRARLHRELDALRERYADTEP